MEKNHWLTVREAVDYLGVTRHTLTHWRRQGTGPVVYRLGSHYRYKAADLAAWVESPRINPINAGAWS